MSTSLAYLPMYHSYGLHQYCFRCFLAPQTLVVMSKWDINTVLDAIPKLVNHSSSDILSETDFVLFIYLG
jgi:acyl-CoA synthetase (AMP-forming)/AMP-acid ligase II